MQLITITGGRTLHGRIRPAAAKNSVLPLLAATLLCRTPSRLRAVPPLADVATSLALLQSVGAKAERQGSDLFVAPGQDLQGEIPDYLAGAMRSSVFYLAPLLCRVGEVRLPLPGGCKLGPRPVDIHLAGLAAMGAQVELEGIAVTLRRRGPLHGVDFALRLPSVGATMTLMMAATQAGGTTILRGAACEPEICDLANFLRACGAHITGAGTPVVVIQGGNPLQGTTFRLRGKGIQYLNGRGRGDMYVKCEVEIPKKLNKTQREALKKFEGTLKEENYEKRKGFFKKLKDMFNN